MTETNERVTVDFDSQSYYLDGEYWESWDNYGEEMADKINELLNELNNENKKLQSINQDHRDYIGDVEADFVRLEQENKKLKSLLKECKHELTSNTGLSAFDKCASYIGYVEVFDKDIIDLDYSELLEKINEVDLE